MAKRFHVSKDGMARACWAELGPCPLGDETAHFSEKADAVAEGERRLEEEFGAVATHTAAKTTGSKFNSEAAERAKAKGFAVTPNGEVTYEEATPWGPLEVLAGPSGATFKFKHETPMMFGVGPTAQDARPQLIFYPIVNQFTPQEADSYFEVGDTSREIARVALARWTEAEEVRQEVFTPEGESPAYLAPGPYSPMQKAYSTYQIERDYSGRIVEELNGESPYAPRVLVNDDPYYTPQVRIITRHHEPMGEQEFTEYLHHLSRAVRTGQEIYAGT